jgi:urease accessory protein
MTSPRDGFLAALQLSDSALPNGRFAQSYGVEAYLHAHPRTDERGLRELLESLILRSAAPLDGAAVGHSHAAAAAEDLAALLRLDRLVTSRKLTHGSRRASRSCGRQQASVGSVITASPIFHAFHRCICEHQTDGNLPVVTGVIAFAVRLEARHAILMELRGTAAAILAAAVRLGRLSAIRAQAVLAESREIFERGADISASLAPSEIWSTLPELEVHMLQHEKLESRYFAS